MCESKMKWTLFALMLAVVPSPYFVFVAFAFVPAALIAFITILEPFPGGFVLFNGLYLLTYGAVYYFLARFLAQRIARLSPRQQYLVFGLAMTLALLTTFLPVYGGLGHGGVSLKLL